VRPLAVVFLTVGASSELEAPSDPDSSWLSLPFSLEGFAGEEARGVSSSLLDDSA
jgi:hypothetical protein